MDEFTALVVIPAIAVLYGVVMQGSMGAIVGFVIGVPVGTLLLYAGSDPDDRIEELEREIEELRRTLKEEG